MGLIELAKQLGMDKGLCSRLVKKGMPATSADAANAWREIYAKPRAKRTPAPSPITASAKSPTASAKSPSPPPPSAPSAPSATDSASTGSPAPATEAAESLRRAKQTERASFKNLEQLQKDRTASIEDIRKGSQVYFSSRVNRQKAEADHRDFLRAEGVTLFLDEAIEITNRGNLAVANLLREGPKMLVPRLHGMPAKSQEKTLASFFDGIAEHLRQSF